MSAPPAPATLITGAGVVGSLVAARLLERGDRAVLFDVGFSRANLSRALDLDQVPLVVGDVTDMSDIISAVRAHGITRIVHTAGLLGAAVRARPLAGVRVNLVGTASVLEAARLTELNRVVFTGSASVAMGHALDNDASNVMIEDVPVKLVSEAPPTVYVATKIASEWLCHLYRTTYGVDTVCVRLGGVFGPWDGLLTGQPNKLIHDLVQQAVAGDDIHVGPSDYSLPGIDYVHAQDCAQGLLKALDSSTPEQRVYNVSMGTTHGVDQVVAILSDILGRELRVIVDGEATSLYGSRAVAFDITAARRELGYEVEYPMKRALAEYVDWISA